MSILPKILLRIQRNMLGFPFHEFKVLLEKHEYFLQTKRNSKWLISKVFYKPCNITSHENQE